MDTVKFDKKNTKMIAHRGLSGIELENTCSAFVAAGNRSYYGIETDIYKTADGHFIVGHDDNYKRLSGEEIYLEKETLARLQEVVFFDKDCTKGRVDLRPATLENYLSIVKKYEKHAILELKSDFTDEEIAKIIEIIKSYDYLDNLTFISFNYENLKRVRKILCRHIVVGNFVRSWNVVINPKFCRFANFAIYWNYELRVLLKLFCFRLYTP
jgi:glycerophosphoryl diester phosphodiesterase